MPVLTQGPCGCAGVAAPQPSPVSFMDAPVAQPVPRTSPTRAGAQRTSEPGSPRLSTSRERSPQEWPARLEAAQPAAGGQSEQSAWALGADLYDAGIVHIGTSSEICTRKQRAATSQPAEVSQSASSASAAAAGKPSKISRLPYNPIQHQQQQHSQHSAVPSSNPSCPPPSQQQSPPSHSQAPAHAGSALCHLSVTRLQVCSSVLVPGQGCCHLSNMSVCVAPQRLLPHSQPFLWLSGHSN